jgi:hypothetical protein
VEALVTALDSRSDAPLTLSVEATGELLGISRAAAYRSANRFLATAGAEGLPAVRVNGTRILVPTAALAR